MFALMYFDIGTCFYMFEQQQQQKKANVVYKIHGNL